MAFGDGSLKAIRIRVIVDWIGNEETDAMDQMIAIYARRDVVTPPPNNDAEFSANLRTLFGKYAL